MFRELDRGELIHQQHPGTTSEDAFRMDERESIISRLEAIDRQVAETDQLVESRRIDEARVRFAELKQHLQSEFRRMATIEGDAQLSQLERAFYVPAIQDAWANSGIKQVRADWRPRKWHDALYGVGDYMRRYLSSLRGLQE